MDIGYPIGEQDFKSLREMKCVYVDKTIYIERILNQRSKYFFLARPRRFGKSLFLSTLRYFFEGEQRLFNGLHIDSYAWNWEKYPVLHLDLNPDRYSESGQLDQLLDTLFRKYIIELKFNHDSSSALNQIEEKDYGLPYANDPRRIFKIGVNFSSKTRHLDKPVIKVAK